MHTRIQLECQIEDNRWIVRFLDGQFKNRSGDYRILPKDSLTKGQILEVALEKFPVEPTVANYCGKLVKQ